MQSDEATKLIMNSALDAIICMDFRGVIIMWTRQAEKIFGWNEEEVLGRQLSDIIIPQRYRERHKSGFKRYLETGENKVLNRVIEIEGLNRDGKEFPIELAIVPIKEKGNQFFCAFLRDISERKKVEEELRNSEMRYRSLINHASDAIFLSDMEGNFLDVNESFCAISGYSREELLNMNAADLLEPEHLKANPIPFERFKAGENVFMDRRVLLKNGNVIDMEVNSKKIGENMVLGIARDVTERRKAEEQIVKSEQKYRALIEQASDPIMVTDFKGNFVDVNMRLCDTFGYTKEELLKMNIYALVDQAQVKEKPIQFEFLASGQQLFSERRMKRRDGSFIEVEANVKKVDNNHVMAIARDVTERKKVQKELEKSHKQLRQLSTHLETVREEERTNIAREIHDELGQQLTGLKMDLSSLNKKIPVENKAARKKIASMMALLDITMKTVRHISSELRPGILDDLGLTDALTWQSSEFEKRTGVHCQFKSKLRLRSFEKNLSTGIFRVYQETLTNVARHAKATKVSTTLEADSDSITLKVQDNGKGFNEAEIKNKNTLGLIGMKERAMMFGGKLSIESEKGKGTVVTLLVPIKALSKK
jgi:PAS domain S-box-containing protein